MPGDVVVVAVRDDHHCWLQPVAEDAFIAPRGPVSGSDWAGAAARILASITADAAVDLTFHCYVPQMIGQVPVFGIATVRMTGSAAPSDSALVPVALEGLRGVADELAADAPTVIALQAIALDGLPKAKRRDLTAFVGEHVDPVHELYTGEFGCELSSDSSLKTGPSRVTLAEALAWARRAAPRVDLEIGGRRYSAGSLPSHEGYELWLGQIEPVARPTGREPLI